MSIPNDSLPTLPFLHQNMPDRPNTIFGSSLEFKQALDSSTVAIQGKHNDLVTSLQDSGAGTSAAQFLGSEAIAGLTGTTVRDQLTNAKTQIDGKLSAAGGTIAGNLTVNGTFNATTIQEGGTNLTAKYLQLTGGTLTGTLNGTTINATAVNATTITGTTINATGNLQENGTNLTGKYLQLSGGTLTGSLGINQASPIIAFSVSGTQQGRIYYSVTDGVFWANGGIFLRAGGDITTNQLSVTAAGVTVARPFTATLGGTFNSQVNVNNGQTILNAGGNASSLFAGNSNGRVVFSHSASLNTISSGDSGGSAVRDLTIEGNSGGTITNLTLRATTVAHTGAITATSGQINGAFTVNGGAFTVVNGNTVMSNGTLVQNSQAVVQATRHANNNGGINFSFAATNAIQSTDSANGASRDLQIEGVSGGTLSTLLFKANNVNTTGNLQENGVNLTTKYVRTDITRAYVLATVTATQNFTTGSSHQAVNWTETIDQTSSFDGTTFTAPRTGIYQISAVIHIATATTGDYYQMSLYNNGTIQHRMAGTFPPSTGTNGTTLSGSISFRCTAGDQITIRALSSVAGRTIGNSAAQSFLSIAEIPTGN